MHVHVFVMSISFFAYNSTGPNSANFAVRK